MNIEENFNITVVGTGYVGLVTGACLAEMGNSVICVDTDEAKVEALKNGIVSIYEPGLDAFVGNNLQAQRLRFTTDIATGVRHARIIFIAVGTPPNKDHSADLKYVLQVANAIGETITDYRIIATKSTVPVGTADKVRATLNQALQRRGVECPFSVVSNPEFLKEGGAINDFMKPDRIIIGTEADDNAPLALMRKLYAPFNRNHERIISMDIRSAELTKYAANAMLATKISFMNEMSNLAETLGADIEAVRIGIGADPRIGYDFIYPGCGYGGSCFPKDVQALQTTACEFGYDARILTAVEAVNKDQKQVPVNKLLAHFGGDVAGMTIALWGLSFKPDTDDMREAPSRVVIDALLQKGAKIQAYDPAATQQAERLYAKTEGLLLNSSDPYQVLEGAEALVVVTEWHAFRAASIKKIKSILTGDVIVDARNIFSPDTVRAAGLHYYGIGR